MTGAAGHGEGARGSTFSASKFAVPEQVRTSVPRPDLERRLGAGRSRRVTLVIGSPGASKTTVLSAWARAQPDGTVAWLSCDRGDADDGRFWSAVIAAIATIRPGFGQDCLDQLALNRAVDQDFLESLLTACSADIGPLELVIDDLQVVAATAQGQLGFVLGRGLDPIRVLIGTRSEPTGVLDRLRVAGELAELREHDLRFSSHEAGLLLRNVGVDLPASGVDLVLERTEGWAAGLRLAAVALRSSSEPEALLSRISGSHQIIGHYLWSEVFEAQNPEIKRFLLDTSIVDELCPSLAAALSPGTPVTLLDIEAANLLLLRLDPVGETFRYHQLFGEMLRFRLRSTDPEQELELHRRAAAWYLEHRDSAAAFRHQWRSGQRTAAIATVHGTVLDAYYDDRLPAFSDADRLLADEDLIAAPDAATSYSGALLTRGFLEDAERLASRVEVVASGLLTETDRQVLLCVRLMAAFAAGDTKAAIRLGDDLLAQVDTGVERTGSRASWPVRDTSTQTSGCNPPPEGTGAPGARGTRRRGVVAAEGRRCSIVAPAACSDPGRGRVGQDLGCGRGPRGRPCRARRRVTDAPSTSAGEWDGRPRPSAASPPARRAGAAPGSRYGDRRPGPGARQIPAHGASLSRGDRVESLAATVYGLAEPEGFLFPLAEAGSSALEAVRCIAHTRPRSGFVDDMMNLRPGTPPRSAVTERGNYESLSVRERTVLSYLDYL